MVDVAHHCHNWGSRTRFAFDHQGRFQLLFKSVFANKLNSVTHFFNHEGRCVLIDGLVYGRHDTQPHQHLNHFTGFDCHSRRQLTNGNHLAHFHFS